VRRDAVLLRGHAVISRPHLSIWTSVVTNAATLWKAESANGTSAPPNMPSDPPLAARQQSCPRRSLDLVQRFGATTTAVSSAPLTSAFMRSRFIFS
jgi:hypothetical protein